MEKNGRIRRIICVILAIAASLGVYQLPLPGLEGSAKTMIFIFVLVAILWITEAMPLYVTAFLVPILTAITGILTPTASLAPFFDPVIALLLGGFILSISINKYGLDKKFAMLVFSRMQNKPIILLITVMGITAFFSMWFSNSATTIIMLAILLPTIDRLPENEPFARALILSIPFAANIGGMGTPVGTTPNPIAISFLEKSGIKLTFIDWMAIAIPLQVLYLIGVILILLLFFRPKKKYIEITIEKLPKIGRQEKIVLFIFLLTVILWLTSKLHGVPDSIIALLPIILLNGMGFLDAEDFGKAKWDVLALIAGGMALGIGMQKSGLDVWIVKQIKVGGLHPVLILMAFAALAAIITTFMSNTATAALLIPVVGTFGVQFDMSTQMVFAVAIVSSAAMALPVSTPPNAIAYGTGRLKLQHMMVTGTLITLWSIIITSFIGNIWWSILGY